MRIKLKNNKNTLFYFLMMALMFVVFAVTRLWKNDIMPNGLHIDEAAIAYDAWSLVNYGVDRHLKSWPVYLINFGGGQNVLYCYILAGLFKLFGFSFNLIRVPAVIFSFLTLMFGMLLVGKLFHDRSVLSLAAGSLVIICPYFIMASRFGLESSLMVGMSTVFLYCLVCAIDSARYRWYILSGITGGLVLYTYAIAYVALPIFLMLTLIYTIRMRRFSFPRWLGLAIPMGILAFPLILEQYINAFDLEEIHLGIFTVTKLTMYRLSEMGLPNWHKFANALYSIFIGDNLAYNSIPGFANLYRVTVPLVMIGVLHALIHLIRSWKKREATLLVYPFFWFLAMLVTLSCVIGSNTNKVNGIFFVVIFLAVEGIYALLEMGHWKRVAFEIDSEKDHRTLELQKMYWCKAAVAICAGVYGIGFIRFGGYYFFGGYSNDYQELPYFDPAVTEAVAFLEENPEYRNERTCIAENVIYLAISALPSPYDLRIDESYTLFLDYYYCGSLDAPEDGCNYIVRDIHPGYAQMLRDLGYTEIDYGSHLLFYQEE